MGPRDRARREGAGKPRVVRVGCSWPGGWSGPGGPGGERAAWFGGPDGTVQMGRARLGWPGDGLGCRPPPGGQDGGRAWLYIGSKDSTVPMSRGHGCRPRRDSRRMEGAGPPQVFGSMAAEGINSAAA